MSFSKRLILYMFIILLVASIYKDLSLGDDMINQYQDIETFITKDSQYTIIKVKVEWGDTVLSIIKDLNEGKIKVPFEKIINDFQELNPNIDPNSMEPENYYYFPLYK
ncbi:hypothetical protein [Oceanobacillus caeni]|uniref:hypothetical protein n=1 Tax=Oceanobacillus caeni TaxID=405946 RepID=UPI00195E7FD0|nr:hypothetical protein [Oceanobacillus caeni]MBU8789442.1 hypothetical protein [Oceanobacillus caeni]